MQGTEGNTVRNSLIEVEEIVNKIVEKNLVRTEARLLEHERQVKACQEELARVKASIAEEQKVISNLREKVKIQPVEVDHSKTSSENECIYTSLITYSTRLGLQIRKLTPYSLEFSFYHMHPSDHEYKLTLYLDNSNSYQIRECIPNISDLSVLLEALNQSNDLPVFIKSIRQRFKSMNPSDLID